MTYPKLTALSAVAISLFTTGSALRAEELSYGAVCSSDGQPLPWVSPAPEFAGFVFNESLRWSETATDAGPLDQGDPTTVTWGVAPDGSFIPGFFGEPSGDSDLVALLDSLYGNEAAWLPLFQEAFDAWEAATGVDFVHEPNDDGATINSANPGELGVRPDLRIGGKFIDGKGGSLAFGLFPEIGDLVLDSADSKYTDTSNDSFNLKQIVMHEIGHTLGISHVCPANQTKLMEPTFIDAFFGPQIDDISAGQRGYGDPNEPNDSEGAETSLGVVTTGDSFSIRLASIDDNGDTDRYGFSLNSTETVTVSIVPMGQIYPSEGEQGGGGCDASAPNYNGVQVHDLRVQVLDSNSDVVATGATGQAGDSEQLEMSLGADDYTVMVQGSSANAMQLYGLWITAEGRRMTPPSPGIAGVVNTVELRGASPSGSEFFVLGFGSGDDPIPTCSNLSELDGIRLLQSDTADGGGDLTFTFTPPAGAAGKTGFFQVIEGGTCEVTNLITATF